jgi:hypothetical protein
MLFISWRWEKVSQKRGHGTLEIKNLAVSGTADRSFPMWAE